MAKKSCSQDYYSLFPKKQFHWTSRVSNEVEDKDHEAPTINTIINDKVQGNHNNNNVKSSSSLSEEKQRVVVHTRNHKLQEIVGSVLKALRSNRNRGGGLLGRRPVVGTLFGYRRGNVQLAFQREAGSTPAFLIELATPISSLVREMASGLVRIAFECDKDDENYVVKHEDKKEKVRLLMEETLWRTYCNGKSCGFGTVRACGPKDWNLLKALEPISTGAGVLPQLAEAESESVGGGGGGDVMYMRAKFERVVGSRDSEAFYMMNPDCNGTPELSIYFLRF